MFLLWATVTVTFASLPLSLAWDIVLNRCRAICSTAFEPALCYIMADFEVHSDFLASFKISIYVVGYCFGSLIIAPASELYGRIVVLYPSFIVYLVTPAICDSSANVATFIIFWAVMEFVGNAFPICGRAVIEDIIRPQRRGIALSLVTSGPTLVSGIWG